jgi:ACS family hexuronate transporter-like MFS transporter
MGAARKTVFFGGVGLSLCSALVPLIPGNVAGITLIAIAIFGLNWKSCTQLAIITDIFPESTLARLGGLTGIAEGLLTMAVTLGTGMIVDRFSFTPVFFGAAVLPILSALALFVLIGRIRKIGFPAPSEARA